jgi:hypothetical protein
MSSFFNIEVGSVCSDHSTLHILVRNKNPEGNSCVLYESSHKIAEKSLGI